jgi:hypothetical protein
MDAIYSKEQFEGYTHRFIVRLEVDEDWQNAVNVTIYSNSSSYIQLEELIKAKKSSRVVSFVIEHRVSKEQDELNSKFIDEVLNSL